MIRVLSTAMLLLLIPGFVMAESLDLDHYTLQAGPIRIKNVLDNASGLTFNRETKSLFMVVDEPELVIELDREGGVRRTIPLKGFQDVEGITHIEGAAYAVVEERRGMIRQIRISEKTSSIDYSKALKIAAVPRAPMNDGIEGISFDSAKGLFYMVKEINPRKIYSFPLRAGKNRTRFMTHPWDAEKHAWGLRDFSGIYYHAETGHLLVLSDESKCVVECTTNGKEMGRLSLMAGHAGLRRHITKPEGITMDHRGKLYILSEPNLLYVFARRK